MWEFVQVFPNAGGQLPDTVAFVVHPLAILPEELDPMSAMNSDSLSSRPDRPYVLTNMVASMDGAIAVDGLSGGLGGPADFKVFMALRSLVDVIVAGAGTVRDEQYKAPQPGDQARAFRRDRGQRERPLIVVVSRGGKLPTDLPLFEDETYRPLIVTGSDADPAALAALAPHADVEQLDSPGVVPTELLTLLHARGHRSVLLEGGPSLNGAFIDADCIDEWNLTLSPHLVGGSSGRASRGAAANMHRFAVSHVWTDDDLLFVQWKRRRSIITASEAP